MYAFPWQLNHAAAERRYIETCFKIIRLHNWAMVHPYMELIILAAQKNKNVHMTGFQNIYLEMQFEHHHSWNP
uniref:Uncharacterized protein n=1 Tax=Arundo donax TaxID=35708 RepID=A0A0A8Y5S4_ARUDO